MKTAEKKTRELHEKINTRNAMYSKRKNKGPEKANKINAHSAQNATKEQLGKYGFPG